MGGGEQVEKTLRGLNKWTQLCYTPTGVQTQLRPPGDKPKNVLSYLEYIVFYWNNDVILIPCIFFSRLLL